VNTGEESRPSAALRGGARAGESIGRVRFEHVRREFNKEATAWLTKRWTQQRDSSALLACLALVAPNTKLLANVITHTQPRPARVRSATAGSNERRRRRAAPCRRRLADVLHERDAG